MSEPKGATGWNANEEKLLALIVVSDARAEALSCLAGEAFFRAFIVENRTTGAVGMNFRFRYRSGADSWFSVKPNARQSRQDSFRELREGMTKVVLEASNALGISLSPLDVECFEPPDDEGQWERTIQWLMDRDLIHPPRIERIDDDGPTAEPASDPTARSKRTAPIVQKQGDNL